MPDSTPLADYRRRKLDLADIIRGVLNVAHERGDEEVERRARSLLARLAEDAFQLAVVGQFSRGKSTLMNALMGHPYLPTGVLPMTSAITTVVYGQRSRVTVHRQPPYTPVDVSFSELPRYVTERSGHEARGDVTRVEVQVPAELLRLGFEFVDTPGIGSAIVANTATTQRYLPDADALIFVTSAETPLTADEARFFGQAGRFVDRLFVVVNKLDLVSRSEIDQIIDFVRARLDEQMGDTSAVRIFALSALQALEARANADQCKLEDSGVPALERALVTFLTTEKEREFFVRVARRSAELVTRQQVELRLSRIASGADGKLQALDERLESLMAGERAVAIEMIEEVAALLPGALQDQAHRWRDELSAALLRIDSTTAVPARWATGRQVVRNATTALEVSTQAPFEQWAMARQTDLQRTVLRVTAPHHARLRELRRSVNAIGPEVFGLAARPEPEGWQRADLPPFSASRTHWMVDATCPWWFGVIPSAWIRNRVSGQVRASAENAVDAAVARMLAELGSFGRPWAEELAARLEDETRQAADRFRSRLQAPVLEQHVTLLDDLRARIAEFETETDSARTMPGVTPAQDTSIARCPVCRRLQSAIFRYLSEEQFQLARRERRQAEHARTRGFCPLHTWQYAQIGDPLGISVAYVALTAETADALRDIAAQTRNTREARDRAVSLLQRSDRCPACLTLAEAERGALADVATALAARPGEPPTLCLPHLLAALRTDLEADAARHLLARLAETLARVGEDMRTYALKRDSFRRELLSHDEQQAHRRVLEYLAGAAGLVLAWKPEE